MTVGAAACVLAGLALVLSCLAACLASWCNQASIRSTTRLWEDVTAERNVCTENLAGLTGRVVLIERSMQTADELLDSGRLSHSRRAQALQLLRMGVSPDDAAVKVGMASREVRLLAKVSRALASS